MNLNFFHTIGTQILENIIVLPFCQVNNLLLNLSTITFETIKTFKRIRFPRYIINCEVLKHTHTHIYIYIYTMNVEKPYFNNMDNYLANNKTATDITYID